VSKHQDRLPDAVWNVFHSATISCKSTSSDDREDKSRLRYAIPAASTLPVGDNWRRSTPKPLPGQGFWHFLTADPALTRTPTL
jgi:hypothetical protein